VESRYRSQSSTPATVTAAVDFVEQMTIASLEVVAVKAEMDLGGSWWDDSPFQMANALLHAGSRRPIAEAIGRRFGDELQQPVHLDTQEVWLMDLEHFELGAPLGSDRKPPISWHTATWEGLFTASTPPPEIVSRLLFAWEFDFAAITRWHVHVDPAARVFEIRQPDDWQELVERHPSTRPVHPNPGWELPGLNWRDISSLLNVPGQRAAREQMRSFVEPDWNSVAAEFDGVHLTWAGAMTCEGTIIDLPDGDVAMLRGWCSERTLWLNPVLKNPTPLAPPHGAAALFGYEGDCIDPRDHPERLHVDLDRLRYKLRL